jgi:ABC-type polysaccharide/polyol phosphate export permease
MMLAGFDRRDMRMCRSLFRMTLGDRFLGSALGLAWAVLSPALLMAIFTFVFTFVFPNRLPGREGALPYVIWLLSGYGPWLATSEGMSSATVSVISNAGVVKNIAFKSELLPIVGSLLAIVPLSVSLVVIFALQIVSGELPKSAYLFLPAAIVIHFVFLAGLGLFLGALNVFIRDTALALPNALTALLFASPIFYPLTVFPPIAQAIQKFNPFYVIAECYRGPLLDGKLPQLGMVAYMTIVAMAVFLAGLWWFRRLKSFFDTRL